MLLFLKNSLHIVWCFSCLSWAKYLQTEWAHGWGSLWQFPMLRTDWLPVTARDLHLALSLLTAAVPMMVGGGGTVRLVTLIVWWHSPYWVMINYPISWMGFHNRLLIVSSSTPTIVIGLSNNRNSICVTFSMSEGKIRHNLSTASIKADISYLNQKIFSWLVGFQWYKLNLTTLISLIRNLQFIPGLSLSRHCY